MASPRLRPGVSAKSAAQGGGVALVGAGHMPAPGEGEREEAKLFYVGATRAIA